MQRKLELQTQPNLKLEFTVPGVPRPKDRPRARIAGYGKKQFVAFYNTKEVENAENHVLIFATEAMQKQGVSMFESAIALDLLFYVQIPKSFSRVKRERANNGDIVPVTKPDLDNYVKLVMDAMNKVVYKDDNLVVALRARKGYSDNPGTVIIIEELSF